MRKLLFLVASIVISASSYAEPSHTHSSLLTLDKAWKAKHVTQPFQSQDDITIVYGGADIANRPTLT